VTPQPLQVIGAVCLRTWLKTLRRPVLLAFSFGQPIMWMLFFGFLFHRYGVDAFPQTLTYVDFLLPGVCAMTVLFGASQSGIGLIRDMQTGFLSRLLTTPAEPRLLLIGKLLADVLRLLAQAAVVLMLGVLLGAEVSFSLVAWCGAWCALGLFGTAFSSLSCLIALRTKAQEGMATYVNLVNMPLLFTSTALVPTRQMPEWLSTLSQANPLTLAVNACRRALLFGDAPSLWRSLLPLAALALVLFWAAAATLRREEKALALAS
jgi:ABC-2 type transport system permease protein